MLGRNNWLETLVKTVGLAVGFTLLLAPVAQASTTPKIAQAFLTFSGDTVPTVGKSVSLSATGGSGGGQVSYQLAVPNEECHIKGNRLRANVATTCKVYALKAADSKFFGKRSSSKAFVFRLAQPLLILNVQKSVSINQTIGAEISGGSGDGEVSLVLQNPNDQCHIDGLFLTISGLGACKVIAHKDGDLIYSPADSEPTIVDTRPAYPSLGNPWLSLSLGATAPYPGLKLTVLEGGWSPPSAPESMQYRWLRDGQTIAGAASRTYFVTTADTGKSIAAEVTFNNHLYASVSKQTAPSLPTLRLLNSTIPKIYGTRQVGKVVTTWTGSWDIGVTFKFQWYRNGTLIPGAVSRQYRLGAQDLSQDLQVLVTGSKPGYRSVSHLTSGVWQPQPQQLYAEISGLAEIENAQQPTINITAGPHVDSAWLARETSSIQHSVNLFSNFQQPTNVDVIYATAEDVDWAVQLFADRGYNIQYGIRWWLERDGCNIALSWRDQGRPVFIQCLGPGRDDPMYQQIGAHEYSHLIQTQYPNAHMFMPGWLTEGSASFYGIATAVYGHGLDMAGVDRYLASYARSNYSYDVAARLPYGTDRLLYLLQDGDISAVGDILNWSSGSGLLYAHTQFLLGGLLTEWLISNYGLDKLQEFYAAAEQEFAVPATWLWAERRLRLKQIFKETYGFDWQELLTASTPYLSARATQLLSARSSQ